VVAVPYLTHALSSACFYAFTMEFRGVSQVGIRLTTGPVRDFFQEVHRHWKHSVRWFGHVLHGSLSLTVGTLILSSAGDHRRVHIVQ
jgi:hypothetical protein